MRKDYERQRRSYPSAPRIGAAVPNPKTEQDDRVRGPFLVLMVRRAAMTLAFLAVTSGLMAQSGRVRMRMIDPAGSVVAGAEVFSKGTNGKSSESLRSNSFGEVTVSGLPIGDVTFVVSADGLRPQSLTVRLRSSDEVKVEVRLGLGVVTVIDWAAASPTGRVRIRVLDPLGHPVANPSASLLGSRHNAYGKIGGNNAGEVVLENLPLGRYDFLIQGTGFQSQIVTEIYLNEGEEPNIQAILQFGNHADTITVCSGGCGVLQTISSPRMSQLEPLPQIPDHKFYVSGLKE